MRVAIRQREIQVVRDRRGRRRRARSPRAAARSSAAADRCRDGSTARRAAAAAAPGRGMRREARAGVRRRSASARDDRAGPSSRSACIAASTAPAIVVGFEPSIGVRIAAHQHELAGEKRQIRPHRLRQVRDEPGPLARIPFASPGDRSAAPSRPSAAGARRRCRAACSCRRRCSPITTATSRARTSSETPESTARPPTVPRDVVDLQARRSSARSLSQEPLHPRAPRRRRAGPARRAHRSSPRADARFLTALSERIRAPQRSLIGWRCTRSASVSPMSTVSTITSGSSRSTVSIEMRGYSGCPAIASTFCPPAISIRSLM